MKKQILILTFFVAAIFAGTTSAFGQVSYQTVPTSPQCITPMPLTGCTITAPELHPIQGVYYDYTVTVNPAVDPTVRWFVVNNYDLSTNSPIDSLVSMATGILAVDHGDIDATDAAGAYEITAANPSTYILDVTDGANIYNNEANTTATINMAWKFFNGSAPEEVLLVAYVEGADGCTDNIAVWRIIPTPAFTLDVATLNAAGDSIAPSHGTGVDVADTCVSPIEWATYSSSWGTIDASTTPGDSLRVDYGENWMFFVVNAANYIDSWMPTFQFSYGSATDAIPSFTAQWAYIGDANSTDPANWHDITGTLGTAASNFASSDPVIAGGSAALDDAGTTYVGGGLTVGASGECIVVRVRLDWGLNIEHDDANSTLRFAVDGVSYDGVETTPGDGLFFDDRGYADLGETTCADDQFTNDWLDYIITPRPGADEGTPDQEAKSGDEQN
nr:hypothetical protein [uncultured Draconibacterium sp.]